MSYFTSPELLMLQSRLYSPGYGGPGRWVIFKPSTRKAFAAIGSDVVPDVVAVLAAASSPVGATRDQLKEAAPKMNPEQIEKLVEAELLLKEPPATHLNPISAVAHYHVASFDYPFLDYADPACTEEEKKLMESYMKMWSAPPSLKEFHGPCIPLPPVERDTLPINQGLTLEKLAALLSHTFAPIGEIPTSAVVCIRRTSPSGGARHPTECVVVLRKSCGEILPGAYYYNSKQHSLVPAELDEAKAYCSFSTAPATLIIRSYVERAMWRYRDLRAFRPVLLDAGHIIETISLLLSKMRLSGRLGPPPLRAEQNFAWLIEPELATIHIGDESAPLLPNATPEPIDILKNYSDLKNHGDESQFLTNPVFYMKFEGGALRGYTVWPRRTNIPLGLKDFRVLSHCQPSNRGDRITTKRGINEVVPELPKEKVQQLFEVGALLPRHLAEAFYETSRLWIRYGWYITELAHLESIAAQHENGGPQDKLGDWDALQSIRSLYTRRTSRVFGQSPITCETLETLLEQALPTVSIGDSSPLKVFVTTFNVVDLEKGLYRWTGRLLEPMIWSNDLDHKRDTIRQMTIGQYPAGAGSFALWLVYELNPETANTYEIEIIRLGRLGQRLCLKCAEMDLGIFLTPAVSDEYTAAALGIPNPLSVITYFFSIGSLYGH